jgi:hypothetical protein
MQVFMVKPHQMNSAGHVNGTAIENIDNHQDGEKVVAGMLPGVWPDYL